jgi:hypothetical protein
LARAAVTSRLSNGPINDSYRTFEWVEHLGWQSLNSGDQLRLEFDLIPFSTPGPGLTELGFDCLSGTTFFGIQFQNGLVNQRLAYRPAGWNKVVATIDIASQTFTFEVNG